MRVASALLAAAFGLGGTTAATAEQIVLKPSGNWVLDYASDKCRLARTFGEGEQRVVLLLDQHEPSASFAWTVAGPPVDRIRSRRRLDVQFGPSMPARTVDLSMFSAFGDLPNYGSAFIHVGYRDPVEAEGGPKQVRRRLACPSFRKRTAARSNGWN